MSKELKYAHIIQEHVVNAPRDKVYKALTEEANAWWSHTRDDKNKVTMGFDGPCTGCFSFTLEERGKSTLIKLEHKFFGPLSNETEGMYQEGWKELLGGTFKDFVEKGTRLR